MTWINHIHVGDCRDLMKRMFADGVQVNCVVTSPPYWGLRDYGVDGQYGLEATLSEWLERQADVFEHVRALLARDGVLWLNMGDAYAGAMGGAQGLHGERSQRTHTQKSLRRSVGVDALKSKDMMGQPWRLAFALQSKGWYLRADVIWHKPNPMPESIRDRPAKAHEYVFLLSKSGRYHYDAKAIAEPTTGNAHSRGNGVNPKAAGWASGAGSDSAKDHARAKQGMKDSTKFGQGAGWRSKQNASFSGAVSGVLPLDTRNARSVWTIPTEPTSFAHFACFPRELVRRCILAGSRENDIVFDPFMGSGTVAEVALSLGRRFIGCELNPEYAALFKAKRSQQTGMAL